MLPILQSTGLKGSLLQSLDTFYLFFRPHLDGTFWEGFTDPGAHLSAYTMPLGHDNLTKFPVYLSLPPSALEGRDCVVPLEPRAGTIRQEMSILKQHLLCTRRYARSAKQFLSSWVSNALLKFPILPSFQKRTYSSNLPTNFFAPETWYDAQEIELSPSQFLVLQGNPSTGDRETPREYFWH